MSDASGRSRRESRAPARGSASFFRVQATRGPVIGREANPPEVRIGSNKFECGAEFCGRHGFNQHHSAVDLLAGPYVLQGNALPLLKHLGHFDQGAMRIHDDGVSLFAERGLIGQFAGYDHANLQKKTLAAPPVRGGVHYRQAPGMAGNPTGNRILRL